MVPGWAGEDQDSGSGFTIPVKEEPPDCCTARLDRVNDALWALLLLGPGLTEAGRCTWLLSIEDAS